MAGDQVDRETSKLITAVRILEVNATTLFQRVDQADARQAALEERQDAIADAFRKAWYEDRPEQCIGKKLFEDHRGDHIAEKAATHKKIEEEVEIVKSKNSLKGVYVSQGIMAFLTILTLIVTKLWGD